MREGGRIPTQIDDHVIKRPSRAANHFSFGVRSSLIVKSAQGAFSSVEGYATLHELGIQPLTSEFLLAPGAGEISAFVSFRFEMNFECPWQSCFVKSH